MTFEALLEYGGWIVVLYAAALAGLQGVWKPFILHPIRRFLQEAQQTDPVTGKVTVWVFKKDWYGDLYTFLALGSLFLSGIVAAGPFLYELDIFGRWGADVNALKLPFGLEYSAWYGTIVSCLIMAMIGEQLHDYFAANDINLPMTRKKKAPRYA